jgi:hypothetical protein
VTKRATPAPERGTNPQGVRDQFVLDEWMSANDILLQTTAWDVCAFAAQNERGPGSPRLSRLATDGDYLHSIQLMARTPAGTNALAESPKKL